ncbi:peptidylprolyl isomerase [Candidatus Palauibacter sp.]|uniref:peptidylprolyl isomerase n=1 Tax=Candidatus Palauibacter sp. TaxID=3101350 RepID=UPI003B5CF520
MSESLGEPASAELNMTAPETFRARFETSKGTFVVEAHRAWSPNGVDRFYNLVRNGFFHEVRFFRVIDGFMAQFGINGRPGDPGRLALGEHPRRSRRDGEHARAGELRHGRSGHAQHATLHQLRR